MIDEPIYSFNQVSIIQYHLIENVCLSKQLILYGGKRQNKILLLIELLLLQGE
jgi:hypothetical protein